VEHIGEEIQDDKVERQMLMAMAKVMFKVRAMVL